MKIIYLGTPEFAVKPLQSILSSKHQVLAVVTQPDKSGNRNKIEFCAVKKFALEKNIPLYQFNKISVDGLDIIKEMQPDCIVTSAYGQILSDEFLKIAKYGVLNIHGSILPKYRGAAPIQWAIINGEQHSGVSIMKTVKALDAGNILLSKSVEITPNMTSQELFSVLSEVGAELIVQVLDNLSDNTNGIPQDESNVTFCTKLTKDIAKIDWSKSYVSIHNLIRGCFPSPIAHTKFNNRTVKIISSERVGDSDTINSDFGAFQFVDKELIVDCGIGKLKIFKLQLENGNIISSKDFINGIHAVKGRFDHE